MRFGPLQHIQERQVHDSRVCLTRCVPSPGFLTLLTACSLSARPTVFQVGSAPGVVPFRAFLLAAKPTRLSTHAALLMLTIRLALQSTGNALPLWSAATSTYAWPADGLAGAVRPSSGFLTSPESVSTRAGIRRSSGSMLSWGSCLSRVLRRPDLGRAVAGVPPPASFVSRPLPAGL
jgi:hypothetical protein